MLYGSLWLIIEWIREGYLFGVGENIKYFLMCISFVYVILIYMEEKCFCFLFCGLEFFLFLDD